LRRRLLASLTVVMSAPLLASPQPTINFQLEHYLVSGASTDELERSIFESTPVFISGRRYGAVTKNEFATSYAAVGTSEGGCEVRNVKVLLNSTVILPKLAPGRYSGALLAEWQRYIGALTAHEMQHANNGKYTAETLAKRLYNFKAPIPCSQMKPKLDQALDRLVKNMGHWDLELDRQTAHGATQGATLKKGVK